MGTYRITVNNPSGKSKGAQQVRLNGQPIQGNKLPLASPGETVEVTIEM